MYYKQKKLKRRIEDDEMRLRQLHETLMKTRSSTAIERGTQTLDVELNEKDLNVNKDLISPSFHEDYSPAIQPNAEKNKFDRKRVKKSDSDEDDDDDNINKVMDLHIFSV